MVGINANGARPSETLLSQWMAAPNRPDRYSELVIRRTLAKPTRTARWHLKPSGVQERPDAPGAWRSEPARDVVSRWLRSRAARDTFIAATTALFTGVVLLVGQSLVDDHRQQGTELVENLRFVRERSSEQAQVRPFSDMNLQDQTLSGLSLDRADFSGADLAGTRLLKMGLSQAVLEGANLRSARVGDTRLVDSNLSGADLTGAIILRSDLTGANLDQVRSQAWFGGNTNNTTINRSILAGVSMSDAELSRATVYGTDFRRSNLRGADLFWTTLRFVNLSGADLSGSNVDTALLENICYDASTIWPENFNPPPNDPAACGVPFSLDRMSDRP
ncbi:Uncharacterized protein YjbI, contains pentapeptide repeats [Arthrobacter sp. ok362]|nr:Uncharacterized protein YjbI, contains pentapeptide repeats [Arthrobacter sp. ok362]